MDKISTKIIKKIYKKLYDKFGPQYWWPAKTKFEVMLGAILTQNTNWGNVEKAIMNLRKADILSPLKVKKISVKRLASLIKPSGYYNIKAARIKNFVNFIFKEYKGNLCAMGKEPLDDLREKLLGINGIGPETADSILLYALDKPIFVVDAYTKRILLRHHFIEQNVEYQFIQKIFMESLPHDIKIFNEYHALIVRLGKEICASKPSCDLCPLKGIK